MASIGSVWDRTTQVLAGRGGVLAGIAAVAIFLPTVVRAGYAAYIPVTPATAIFGGLVALIVLAATIWGQLAIVTLSSDPANSRSDASRVATRRLPLAIALVVLVGVAIVLVLVPVFFAIGRSLGPDAFALMQAGVMPPVPTGVMAFVSLYIVLFGIALIVVGARLIVLNPVIVNERLGLGSIARAFRLTRGWTWKLIGLLILYAIVLLVALAATQAVVGIVLRLILGPNGIATATFLATAAGAVVTTAFSVLATVFATQLYVAVRDDIPRL